MVRSQKRMSHGLGAAMPPSLRPPGRFVAIVGPDGVGKTTLAGALIDWWDGPSGYVHFRPPVLGPLESRPAVTESPPPAKWVDEGFPPIGWLRMVYNLSRFWLGYLTRVRPAVAAGTLVVADRWAYGYLVQPRALKYYGPAALATAIVRLFPKPDVVIVVEAPVEVVLGRKQELSAEQIRHELGAWKSVPARAMLTANAIDHPVLLAERLGSALMELER